jgi:hypothetical protein
LTEEEKQMPTYTPYPGPGKGISIAGLNKAAGWKSSLGDVGINKTAGKSFSGLDQASNPIISSVSLSGVTGTTTTINWTTQIGQPKGSVDWRVAGTTGAWTTVADAATPPATAHSVALSGLTSGVVYEFVITQYPTGGAAVGKQVMNGRFTGGSSVIGFEGETAGVAGVLASAAPLSSPLDGVQNAPAPTPTTTAPAPGAQVSTLTAVATGSTTVDVTWRTEAYTDGAVFYSAPGVAEQEVVETGNKRLNHLVTLTGLQPDTEYTVEVESEDAAGNVVSGGPVSVRTQA